VRIVRLAAVYTALLLGTSQAAEEAAVTIGKPVVSTPVTAKRSAVQDLRAATLSRVMTAWQPGQPIRVRGDMLEEGAEIARMTVPAPSGPDPLLATARAFVAPQPIAAPVSVAGFDGIAATGFLPPDTVGDVGPNHYIQMVNAAFAVYDKQGNLLAGPSLINTLWEGFGGPCESENNGDPIVRYDHLADRWLLSQFAIHDHLQCIAISRGPDPVNDGWFLYAFPTVTDAGTEVTPDYPKIGVWPDGYYMGTQRGFPNGGLDVWVFEREKMLTGAPAAQVQFSVSAPSLFLMPSDLDGPAPPAGTPNFFVRHVDGDRFGGADRLEVFAMAVDWSNPSASTFTQVATLPTAPFDTVLCSAGLLGACVPQPGTNQRLETLTPWLMWRLQYRNFGSHESLVTNHTVDADGNDLAGIRWYELRRSPGGTWNIHQQGTYAPDNVHRWMGSVAMDEAGNMALGYSVSSNTVSPGIRSATRVASDPPGIMAQGEATLVNGNGAQTHSSARWGNYSSMDVDPADPCTFWYTTEYYDATSAGGWKTHVDAFQIPSCEKPVAERFEYAAKLVCGLQQNPASMQLARGYYATTINVHNPQDGAVTFNKKLALTVPPGRQQAGKLLPTLEDKLGPDEALAVDCDDLSKRYFDGQLPASFIEGFVVIRSPKSLNVTAVYSTATMSREGLAGDHSGIHVEQVRERTLGAPATEKPDLVVKAIGQPRVSCPGGTGTCVTQVELTVANVGAADAGTFITRVTLDPAQSVKVDPLLPGLAAGTSQSFMIITPRGGNCYDPDCTVCATVDANSQVDESNESNNQLCHTTPG
jgi:hypothetical protein